jgi:ABC-type multidrug transport system fused ATPase/permease subunit
MEQVINTIKEVDTKTILGIFERIKNIVDSDYILYFEKHIVMENILTLKYDSRKP